MLLTSSYERNRRGNEKMELVLRRMQQSREYSPEFQQRIRCFEAPVECLAGGAILQSEGDRAHRPRFLLSGWACRCRYLADGRRQIFDIVLPGDDIGINLQADKLARTTTLALTAVQTIVADELVGSSAAQASQEMLAVLQETANVAEQRMLDQVTRLGCMSALERLANLVLELHDRAAIVGQASGGRFPFLATQEALSDLLGLSVVHTNRTINELRRLNLAVLTRQAGIVHDRRGLEKLACIPES